MIFHSCRPPSHQRLHQRKSQTKGIQIQASTRGRDPDPEIWWVDPPTDDEIKTIAVTIAKRVIRHLKKNGYFRDDNDQGFPDEESSQEELLARTFNIDTKYCPDCGGEMKIVAAIMEFTVIKQILSHPGIPYEPPDIVQARLPSQMIF